LQVPYPRIRTQNLDAQYRVQESQVRSGLPFDQDSIFPEASIWRQQNLCRGWRWRREEQTEVEKKQDEPSQDGLAGGGTKSIVT